MEPIVCGYFFKNYNQSTFAKLFNETPLFIQENESKLSYGVIRGLHAQAAPHAQAKLVRVIKGKVLDVVVDIRKDSPTFGNVVSELLDGNNKNQLYVPKGCLHGFSVLEDNTIFSYKCDAFYNKESEFGVNPLDSELNIDWKIEQGQAQISEKDFNALSWLKFLDSL